MPRKLDSVRFIYVCVFQVCLFACWMSKKLIKLYFIFSSIFLHKIMKSKVELPWLEKDVLGVLGNMTS